MWRIDTISVDYFAGDEYAGAFGESDLVVSAVGGPDLIEDLTLFSSVAEVNKRSPHGFNIIHDNQNTEQVE